MSGFYLPYFYYLRDLSSVFTSRFLKSMARMCLEQKRCMVFRTWSDSQLDWITNCFPIWELSNGYNEKTFKMRAKYTLKIGT